MTIIRDSRDGVTMAHPYLRIGLEAFKQGILVVELLQVGTAILTCSGLLYLTAIGVGYELGTIADTQHGVLAYKLRQVNLKSLGVMHRIGRATENHRSEEHTSELQSRQ